MSSRSRGDTPNAVAFRMKIGEKSDRRELVQCLLRANLRLGVRRQRTERRFLGEQLVALGRPVHRAGGREHEPFDASVSRRTGEGDGSVEVDVVRPIGVEIADRVVRERRQVHDRVEAGELLGTEIAHVAGERRDATGVRAEVAAAVVERVDPHDVVARLPERRRGDRADVAVVAGDEDPHRLHSDILVVEPSFMRREATAFGS